MRLIETERGGRVVQERESPNPHDLLLCHSLVRRRALHGGLADSHNCTCLPRGRCQSSELACSASGLANRIGRASARNSASVCRLCAPDGRIFAAEDPMDISAPANTNQGRSSASIRMADEPFRRASLRCLRDAVPRRKTLCPAQSKFSVFSDDTDVGENASI